MKTYVVTLLMLLMSVGTFAQSSDDAAFDNYYSGWSHLCGANTPQDFNKAIECFSMVANTNSIWAAPAMTELGYCYFNGLGVPQNRQKAVEYFLKAAPKGEEFAQLYLSYFYREGLYVKKDIRLANYWAEQCSEYFPPEKYARYIKELLNPNVRFGNVKQQIDDALNLFGY